MALKIEEGHQPFTLIAHLRSGVSMAEKYDLDLAGLIASQERTFAKAALTEKDGTPYKNPIEDATAEEVYDMSLPLSRCVINGFQWHWAATCAQPHSIGLDIRNDTYYRSTDDLWIGNAGNRPLPYFSPRGGPYRNVMMSNRVEVTDKLTWRGVGDVKRVNDLMKSLYFIGKRRSVGEGAILRWEIVPHPDMSDDQIASFIHHDEEKILRPIPEACAQDHNLPYDVGFYGIRPPLWHRSLFEELAVTKEPEDDWFD